MKWISVEDRLPDYGLDVLVIAPNCDIIGNRLIGTYFPSSKSWTVYDFAESKLREKVTYWMPLPELPK